MEMNVGETKVINTSRQPSTVEIMIDHTKPESEEYLKYEGRTESHEQQFFVK